MLDINFENLKEIEAAYEPKVYQRAVEDTMKRLGKQASTEVSKAIRGRYMKVKAGEIKAALRIQPKPQGDIQSSLLIYRGGRFDLKKFAVGSGRKVIKTRRGRRVGAKVRILKTRPAQIVDKGFWAKGQIFRRVGRARLPIEKETGPSIAHMARSVDARKTVEDLVNNKANQVLADRINFYAGRRSGAL